MEPVHVMPVDPAGAVRPPRPGAARRAGDAVHPFWLRLQADLARRRSAGEQLDRLTALACEGPPLPPCEGLLPPPLALALDEAAVVAWCAGQPPEARGRLLRLLQGGHLVVPWPLHLLQRQGRFGAAWRRAMDAAAHDFVERVARDDALVRALARGTAAVTAAGSAAGTAARATRAGAARQALAAAVLGAAARAWGTAAPAVLLAPAGCEHGGVEAVAETRWAEPAPVVVLHDGAFAQGPLELLATAFHEATHCAQMARVRDGPDEDVHADLLAASFEHLAARRRVPGDAWQLQRHGLEAEREAHEAALHAALLAARCPALAPALGTGGTLARVAMDGGTPDAQAAVQAMASRDAGLCAHDLRLLAAAEAGCASAWRRREAVAERVCAALARLPALRDARDRSGLLAQAVMAAAPALFFGGSGEAAYLHELVLALLDARAPAAPAVLARRALAQHLPGRDAPQRARRAWRGALARAVLRVLVEGPAPA